MLKLNSPRTGLWIAALAVAALNVTVGTGAHRATLPASGWQEWSPRPEIAPAFRRDRTTGLSENGSLLIDAGDNPAAFGAWRQIYTNFVPGRIYCFEAWYRTEGVPQESRSVIPRLHWRNARGEQVRPPDFAQGKPGSNGWSKVEYVAPAPATAREVEIQLGFGFAPGGRVWWDEVRLIEMEREPQRNVRVATIHHRPRGTRSAGENVAQFSRLITQAAAQKPDIVCLPEGITVVGTSSSYVDVSEPVPGPTTQLLGELADRHECHIVAGLYERSGNAVFNTAVLIGRDGQLIGKYRKTHLPREEWEAGLTPGDEYPVFDTDFGRVGLMICWDVQFPEPARAMALQGADLLLLPIWGGSEVLTRARAIENHVFLVSSGYDMRSFIVDPAGKVVAEATTDSPVAVAEISLTQQILQPWLGDMKFRTWKERRPDIPVETQSVQRTGDALPASDQP